MRSNSILKLMTILVLLGALAIPVTSSAAPEPTIAAGCDPIDPKVCLFPFPNDLYTRPDPFTDTGLSVNLLPSAMPRNVAGKPINPIEYNRNDGWSPGSLLLTYVPGLDLEQTGAPSIKDQRAAQDPDSPVLVINATTLEPHPVWAELDTFLEDNDEPALLIRPAINFDEGTRYVVALRNLKDANGNVIPANPYFAAMRDNLPSLDPLEPSFDPAQYLLRKQKMDGAFATLANAGVSRNDLYLAWDFTVASERNLTERVLSIRDQSFALLSDTTMADGVVQGNSPAFRVTSVCPSSAGYSCLPQNPISAVNPDSRITRVVQGTYVVPNFLSTPGGAPGGGFVYNPVTGLPVQNGFLTSTFTCNVPSSVLSSATDPNAAVTPGRPSLYGHGLLGTQGEVGAGNVKDMGREHRFIFCATDWAGMSIYDAANVAHTIVDLSNFSTMADRMQQGFLNKMFLSRLTIHPQGFASDPAFKGPGGAPLINTNEVFYDGNSQGGIMGGALVAVSPDIRRGVLGVPGMNYSTLLDRSVDWNNPGELIENYYGHFSRTYPNRLDQQLCFSLIQMLWDRGEANGYAHHMTDDPPANTPPHAVLLHVALGDHQVANISADVEARTIGAAIYQPAVTSSKIPAGVIPFWGLTDVVTLGPNYAGSVMVYWDAGNDWPPLGNVPATQGNDPHSKPRSNVNARIQKATFLQTGGYFWDVCGGLPCMTS